MNEFIIKIDGDMLKDMKEVMADPKNKAQPGTCTIYIKSGKSLAELISPRKIELLRSIIKGKGKKGITELANELGRKQEAVSRDANVLFRYRIVEKVRDGQKTYLKALYDKLTISLA